MAPSITIHRTALLACAVAAMQLAVSGAAEPARIVFKNGDSVPVSAVALQGDKLIVTSAAEGVSQGQTFSLPLADHVYGERPAELSKGVALLLMNKPQDALKLLEPIVTAHRVTAKIPGNFWIESARAALVAYGISGNAARCTEIGKEIADATPTPGIDPFSPLGKALLMPATVNAEDRLTALRDLTVGSQPADVSAYASFFCGNLLQELKRPDEALEAYLSVPCLFPSAGVILNAAAETKASELLATRGRRDEATAVLNSALRTSGGTAVADEAKKRLESLK